MKTKFEEIVVVDAIATRVVKENAEELWKKAEAENIDPITKDAVSTLLLGIDIQNDFMEGIGALPVSGSKADLLRLTKWMYNNCSKISKIMCSLDTHTHQQIFHPIWWVDKNGNNRSPFTIITYQDVVDKKWQPVSPYQEESLTYLKHLALSGKKELCIWPYHCIEGTPGVELEYQFCKMLQFHSLARGVEASLIQKGSNPLTEMYGIIKAEYDPTAYINLEVLQAVKEYDAIYVAGQASSHCVLESVKQIVDYYSDQPEVTSKITLLTDCMSPIAGFEEHTIEEFKVLQDSYGVQLRTSVDVVL